MSSRPQVSIIIPTYNRTALLACSIASALAQTEVEVEVIVVDDGSDPPAVVEDRSGRTLLIRTANRGASAARNLGLDEARGDYVMFLDSDDELEPDAAAGLLATLRIAGADMAFSRWRNVDHSTASADVIAPPTPYADSLANAMVGGWVAGSVLMPRRLAARFDPRMVVWEVVLFTCASLMGGASAAFYDAVTVNVRQHLDPARLSVRYDHFEPLTTARAFAGFGRTLSDRGLLNPDRADALNARLLPCLQMLLRAGRPESREVYDAIDWTKVSRRADHRPLSFSWFGRWGGFAGALAFTALNRMIGR